VALICDAMLEAARAGATYEEAEAAGLAAVSPDSVIPGVRELLTEVRLEVLVGDGARLIVLLDPLSRGDLPDRFGPGALVLGDHEDREVNAGREAIDLVVTSTSRRRIRISSHYPFHRVNQRLEFDRSAAEGFRLDIPSGAYVGWEPGETKTVRLVRVAGTTGAGAAQGGAR
jgi:urease subunit gamma/beta